MTFFPVDSVFANLDIPEDNSFSYTGGAPGIDQTLYKLHLIGCPNFTLPVEQCFHCSTADLRGPSLSPPFQHGQSLPIIRERSPTPNRTYAQAVSQGIGAHQYTSPAALAAARQLRPHVSQQQQAQAPVQRPTARSLAQTSDAGQIAQQQSYAQAAQRGQSFTPVRHPMPSSQPLHGLAQQSIAASQYSATQSYGLQQGQMLRHGGYAAETSRGPPRYLASTQRPTNPAQTMLQIPTHNLNSMLRPEYTNNPRDIDSLVQGTQIGSHRRPVSHSSSGNSTPLTPASPGAMSVRSGSSQQSRRTGAALRDPSLPHHCTRCRNTYSKAEDLRRHIQRAHASVAERPHPCPHCHWAFVNPKDLRRHARRHHPDASTSQERFFCLYEDCTKSYTRADNLQRHINKDHVADSSLGLSPSMSRTTSQSSHYAQPYRN